MKKFLSIIICGLVLSFSACSFFSSEETTPEQTAPEVQEVGLKGTIQAKTLSVGSLGTHELQQMDGTIINLQSRIINLNQYLDEQVELIGHHERTEARSPSVFEVSSVKVVASGDDDEMEEEDDEDLEDDSIPKSNIPCAGSGNILCPNGYICEISSDEEDAAGNCISLTSIEETRKKREEAEKKKKAKEMEKEEKNAADENDPNEVKEENEKVSSTKSTNNTTNLSIEENKINNYLNDNLAELIGVSDSNLKIGSLEFAGTNFVAVEYQVGDTQGKVVFSYDDALNFEEKTRYKEGSTTTWELESGTHVLGNTERRVVKDGEVVSVPEGYSLYESNRGFQTQYPRKWYYGTISTNSDASYSVGFGSEPIETGNELVSINVINSSLGSLGKSDLQEETSGDMITIYVKRSDSSSFVVQGKASEAEAIRVMAESLEVVE